MRYIIVFFLATVINTSSQAQCFPETGDAQQIFLVIPDQTTSSQATLFVLEKNSTEDRWVMRDQINRAIVGKNGIAWAHSFGRFALTEKDIKVEGDKKTPAGFFRITSSFGTRKSDLKSYVKLEKEKQYCVDDLRSKFYNQVVPKRLVPRGTTGEDMPNVSLYRRGLFIDYPTNREKRGGSCIFIHTWKSPTSATVGCVALAESDVAELQNRAALSDTYLAVLAPLIAESFLKCIKVK